MHINVACTSVIPSKENNKAQPVLDFFRVNAIRGGKSQILARADMFLHIFISLHLGSPIMPRWTLSSLPLSVFISLSFCLEPDGLCWKSSYFVPFYNGIFASLVLPLKLQPFLQKKVGGEANFFFSLAPSKIRDNKNNVRYLVPAKHRRTGEAPLNGISDDYIWCRSQITDLLNKQITLCYLLYLNQITARLIFGTTAHPPR